jgi:hypothetical protein
MVKLISSLANLIEIVECTGRQYFFDIRLKNFDSDRFLISADQIFNTVDYLIGCVS